MESMELNILCRRDSDADPCNPYNVIGIFTGHEHLLNTSDTVLAGKDNQGRDVLFNQYRMPDVGKNNNSQYGYSIVTLTENKMTIDTRNGNTGQWSHYEKPIRTGPGGMQARPPAVISLNSPFAEN